MEKQLRKRWLAGAAACQAMMIASTASAVVIGFDGGTATLSDGSTVVTSNTGLNSGVASYVEDGVKVQFNFNNGIVNGWGSHIGDYYIAGNAVIHAHWDAAAGTGLQSITFQMQNGSAFDLNYMDVTSNTGGGGSEQS